MQLWIRTLKPKDRCKTSKQHRSRPTENCNISRLQLERAQDRSHDHFSITHHAQLEFGKTDKQEPDFLASRGFKRQQTTTDILASFDAGLSDSKSEGHRLNNRRPAHHDSDASRLTTLIPPTDVTSQTKISPHDFDVVCLLFSLHRLFTIDSALYDRSELKQRKRFCKRPRSPESVSASRPL
jgi:hypothetical protein